MNLAAKTSREIVPGPLGLWLERIILALLFLPFWPGFIGLASLTLHSLRKGRGGKLGLLLEMGSALASGTPAERREAIKMLWLFAYFTLLFGGWIFYAAMIGI